jgi:hypothetical protein
MEVGAGVKEGQPQCPHSCSTQGPSLQSVRIYGLINNVIDKHQ